MKYNYYSFLFFTILSNTLFGQNEFKKNIELNFSSTFKNELLILNDTLSLAEKPLVIKELKFYVSNIQFYMQGKLVYTEPNSYHLIDFSKTASLKQVLKMDPKVVFDSLKFDLGIDSAINSSGALEGDLDPSIGMYWAWQSGYINFKLEGYSKLNPSKGDFFQFHLGGYLQPYLCIQSISFGVPFSNNIKLNLDLYEVLMAEELILDHSIMSPSLKAVQISKNIAKKFTLYIEK